MAVEFAYLQDGKTVKTDANGIALQVLQIKHTHPDGAKIYPTESPYIDDDDVVVDEDAGQATINIPYGFDAERIRKALNQGLNLLTQQKVHSSLTPASSKEMNREKVNAFCWNNREDPRVVELKAAEAKCSTKKEINTLRDAFYDANLKG